MTVLTRTLRNIYHTNSQGSGVVGLLTVLTRTIHNIYHTNSQGSGARGL